MSGLVDKNWKKTGLGNYSTDDILGTLRHYGAQVDEATFKEMAEFQYPLVIGSEWHAEWKGVGTVRRLSSGGGPGIVETLGKDSARWICCVHWPI